MENPLVSIISPTYNHEKYIQDCIQSVINQVYTNWEMIIIDDGSIDSTYSIAQSFSLKDPRIKVYTQKNIGIFRLSETYNFALNIAKGKYIAILEGDDVWFKNKLCLQIKELEENNNIVLSWGKAYSSKEDLASHYALHPGKNIPDTYSNNTPPGNSINVFLFSNFIPALTAVIRKDSLLSIGGFQQKYNLPLVDLPTWLELSLKGTFSYIDEPLGSWRIYPTQVTKTYTTNIFDGFFLLAQETYQKNKEIINSCSYKQLNQYYEKQSVIAYSRSGRYKLIRKDFNGARKDYLKSIFHSFPYKIIWKLRSIVGLVFSCFHLNVEGLAKMLGKDSYIQK